MTDLIKDPSEIAIRRDQKICVVRRNGKYWLGGSGWTEYLALAKCFPENQMVSKIKTDLAMPCEILRVYPSLVACEPEFIDVNAHLKPKVKR